MTSLEKQVLQVLKENARQSDETIAEMLNTTPQKVKSLIKKLEKNNTIIQYTTVINERKLAQDFGEVRALIEIRVKPEKRHGFEAIARRIAKHSNVIEHYLTSGNYDFLIVVTGESMMDISSFVSDRLASIENIVSTSTHFIMKKYKENGVLVQSEENKDRLVITP